MSNKIEAAKIRTALEHGCTIFKSTAKGRRFFDCDANFQIVSEAILRLQLPPASPDSWEQVVADPEIKKQLAKRSEVTPEVPRAPEPEKWDFPFPQFRNVAELKKIPSKVYRDFWFDKAHGELTQRAIDFRAQVEKVIREANEKRSR